MQYVSRYINHKHGIKTARGHMTRGRAFSRATYSANPPRKSRILTLYENRGTGIFYSLTLRLMRPTSICDTGERLAGLAGRVSLKSSVPHFCSIARRDVAPRVSISANIRTISSVLRKYILHHSEHFKHRSITVRIVSFVRQNVVVRSFDMKQG